jgi:hypothetical protein
LTFTAAFSLKCGAKVVLYFHPCKFFPFFFEKMFSLVTLQQITKVVAFGEKSFKSIQIYSNLTNLSKSCRGKKRYKKISYDLHSLKSVIFFVEDL